MNVVLSTGMDFGATFGAERSWRDNALTFSVGTNYVVLDRLEDMTSTTQVNGTGVVMWRRDLGPRWNVSADVGVNALLSIDGTFTPALRPTVGASASYFPDWGHASLSVRRAVAPNLYLAKNTVSDSAVLGVSLPLPWLTPDPREPRLTVAATAGFNRTRTVDLESGDAEPSTSTSATSRSPTPRAAVTGWRSSCVVRPPGGDDAGSLTTTGRRSARCSAASPAGAPPRSRCAAACRSIAATRRRSVMNRAPAPGPTAAAPEPGGP